MTLLIIEYPTGSNNFQSFTSNKDLINHLKAAHLLSNDDIVCLLKNCEFKHCLGYTLFINEL